MQATFESVFGIQPTLLLTMVAYFEREADFGGMVLFNASSGELVSIHAPFCAGLENGTLRPVIAQEIPLTEASHAHRAVTASGTCGKIALVL